MLQKEDCLLQWQPHLGKSNRLGGALATPVVDAAEFQSQLLTDSALPYGRHRGQHVNTARFVGAKAVGEQNLFPLTLLPLFTLNVSPDGSFLCTRGRSLKTRFLLFKKSSRTEGIIFHRIHRLSNIYSTCFKVIFIYYFIL